MYSKTTHDIRVTVVPAFLESQSEPQEHHYVWSYTITIANEGPQTVRLLSRHWIITDGFGRVQEVRGPGVVGEQPLLGPGQAFEYTSGVPLATPTGMMVGSYRMTSTAGMDFDIAVPAFSLDSPYFAPLTQ
ncbi:MAG: Co2+/Mg2+ efflux protein ApaG [Alphaproteobacteria bacterium]|nr:Co2+/Mg2+ efflux protein ApaG [Alphaproteobacteria bacterium]